MSSYATQSIDDLQAHLVQLGLQVPIPSFAKANVLSRPMDIYFSYLADIVAKLSECDPTVAYDAITVLPDMMSGDLAVPLPRLRLPGSKPDELAFEIKKSFKETPSSQLFGMPFADGVQLKLFTNPRILPKLVLPYINDRKALYGKDQSDGLDYESSGDTHWKNVVVEFSSPNIGTEFRADHLRSTIIGASISAMFESMGWKVTRITYLGDWGKNIGLLAAGWKRFGSEELFEQDPLRHIHQIYTQAEELFRPEQEAHKVAKEDPAQQAEIESQGLFAERDEFFKRMEDGDQEAVHLWKRFRDISVDSYTKLYARMNVKFDEYAGESQIKPETVVKVESILKEKGVYEEAADGTWQIDFSKHEARNLGTANMRSKSGTTTYLLRDVAAVLERRDTYNFDKMVYVVTADQTQHFKQIDKVLRLMEHADLADKIQHVSFASIVGLLPSPGVGLLLSDVLDQCQTAVHESMAEEEDAGLDSNVEDAIGVMALMTHDLSVRRNTSYTFNATNMVSIEEQTGPNLQSWHSRLGLILANASSSSSALDTMDFSSVEDDEYPDLLRLLAQFPDVTKMAFRGLETATILSFLFRIIEQLEGIIDEGDEADVESEPNYAPAQLLVFESVRQVLENGMQILGVPLAGAT